MPCPAPSPLKFSQPRTATAWAVAALGLLSACGTSGPSGGSASAVMPPPQLVAAVTPRPISATVTVVPSTASPAAAATATPVPAHTQPQPTQLANTPNAPAAPGRPAAAPQVQAQAFAPLPVGSRLAYTHHSAGSLGSGEERTQVVVGRTTWQGRPALSLKRSPTATDLQDPRNRQLLAVLDGAGHPAAIYQPPLGIQLPLSVGKTWVARSSVVRPGAGRTLPMALHYTVHSIETITVPAGTFTAWRVHAAEPNGDVLRVWLRTGDGLELRRSYRRSASHAMGAGAREVELVSIEMPQKSAAKAAAARR